MASAIALLAVPVALGATPETPKPGQRIDMKVLVLTDAPDNLSAQSWETALKREGVPYERLVLGQEALTDGKLADYAANRAHYQAVIAAPGNITDTGALPAAEATALAKFQTTFGIRQISDNTFPNADHGMVYSEQSGDLDGQTTTLTDTGKLVFPYLQGDVPIEDNEAGVPESFAFKGTPAPGASFQTLLTGDGGWSYLGIYTRPDGREDMVMTVATNHFQTQNYLLRHGMINWVTRGVYLGTERNYFEMHIDDVFLPDERWSTSENKTGIESDAPGSTQVGPDEYECTRTPATVALPECPPEIRMLASDVDRAKAWQDANGLKLDMVYNGAGSEEAGADDPLTARFLELKGEFPWINHTWSHPNLNTSSQETIEQEIRDNITWAQQRGLPIDPTELVTGEHSAVGNSSTTIPNPIPENPNLAPALAATGIRWIASDNSREQNGAQRAIGPALTVPRYPSNVYYNVGTRDEQRDEYNWIYVRPESEGGPPPGDDGPVGNCQAIPNVTTCLDEPVTWEQYVDNEATIMFRHLLLNDPRPHYAHQSNIAEDGVLYDVMDEVLRRYRQFVKPSLVQLSQRQIGEELERHAKWLDDVAAERVSGYLRDGKVHVTTTESMEVPLTGTIAEGTSDYGGHRSGWTTVSGDAVFEPSDPRNTARPVITGAPVPGTTLTATAGEWSGTGQIGFGYQWVRCDAAGAACEAIPNATGATYQAQEADRDRRLRVVVSAGNWISSVSQAESLPTGSDPAPPPASGGTPQSGGGGSAGSGSTSSGSTGGQSGTGAGSSQGGQGAVAPRLSGLGINPRRLAVRKSATIRWTLDRAASLSVRVERVTTGRKVGIRCRPDSKRLRKRSKCVRYVSMGTIKRAAKKGSATLKLRAGKVGRRTLKPGSYRLVVTATDAKGKRSAPRSLTFRVVRR